LSGAEIVFPSWDYVSTASWGFEYAFIVKCDDKSLFELVIYYSFLNVSGFFMIEIKIFFY
jgi:hypothetical protein